MNNNLKKGDVIKCYYDGEDEFVIKINEKQFSAKNVNADNLELYPFVYLHRKDNKVTLKVL